MMARLQLFWTLIIFSLTVPLWSQSVDYGIGIDFTGQSFSQLGKTRPQKDAYLTKIAEYFGEDGKDLEKLWSRGYGRRELIRLLLISQNAKIPLKELIALRDKKKTLSDISKKYMVDYMVIISSSEIIYQNLLTRTTDYE